MIAANIGKIFLEAYNEKYKSNYSAKQFFVEKYYELCAQIFPEEKFAWFGIATQEGIHAKIFQKIKIMY